MMDEYNRGMDPEVKRYFRKIMNSFSVGIMWLLSMATAGLFFDLGIARNGVKWYNIVFYGIVLVSFMGLVYYYYKTWSKKNSGLP
jgi:hypothetical protein